MMRIVLPAVLESIEKATAYLDDILDNEGCPNAIKMQMSIVLDELISNVAQYAYKDGKGDIALSVETLEAPKRVVITIEDSGIPYNPLEKEDPDITLSAEERQIGGLGIFIVKKYMDDIKYAYENKKNILTLVKNIEARDKK